MSTRWPWRLFIAFHMLMMAVIGAFVFDVSVVAHHPMPWTPRLLGAVVIGFALTQCWFRVVQGLRGLKRWRERG